MALAEREVGVERPVPRGIDPHQHLGLRMIAEELLQVFSRLLLGSLLDGVFKVDDHAVGATGQRFADPLRPSGGDEQRRSDNHRAHWVFSKVNSISPVWAMPCAAVAQTWALPGSSTRPPTSNGAGEINGRRPRNAKR
ncbi:hypothetical protein D3C72_1815980 [compost metagenome]